MMHDFRAYRFHQGKLPAYLKLQKEVGRPLRSDEYGKCQG
jgi:hypothetical protein